jgi:hypothetical protein
MYCSRDSFARLFRRHSDSVICLLNPRRMKMRVAPDTLAVARVSMAKPSVSAYAKLSSSQTLDGTSNGSPIRNSMCTTHATMMAIEIHAHKLMHSLRPQESGIERAYVVNTNTNLGPQLYFSSQGLTQTLQTHGLHVRHTRKKASRYKKRNKQKRCNTEKLPSEFLLLLCKTHASHRSHVALRWQRSGPD